MPIIKCPTHGTEFEAMEGCSQCLAEREVNLCDTCTLRNDYPICTHPDVKFGKGIGNDNIIKCAHYVNGKAAPCSIPLNVEIHPKVEGAPYYDMAEEAVGMSTVIDEEHPLFALVENLEPSEIRAAIIRDVTTPETDVAVISLVEQANKYLEYAERRVVSDPESVKDATKDLSLIANTKRAIEKKRKEYVDPLNEQVKEINTFFKTLTEPITEADKITRNKVLDYNREIERQRQEAQRIEDEKFRLAQEEMKLKGEITVDLTPIEKPAETPNRVRTDVGLTSKMVIRKWELEDITKVPVEYLKVDEVAIGKLVRAGIKSITGIKIWEEETLQVRSR